MKATVTTMSLEELNSWVLRLFEKRPEVDQTPYEAAMVYAAMLASQALQSMRATGTKDAQLIALLVKAMIIIEEDDKCHYVYLATSLPDYAPSEVIGLEKEATIVEEQGGKYYYHFTDVDGKRTGGGVLKKVKPTIIPIELGGAETNSLDAILAALGNKDGETEH